MKFPERLINRIPFFSDVPNTLGVGAVPVRIYAHIEKVELASLSGTSNKISGDDR